MKRNEELMIEGTDNRDLFSTVLELEKGFIVEVVIFDLMENAIENTGSNELINKFNEFRDFVMGKEL